MITSKDNDIYKQLCKLFSKKGRDKSGLYVLEGAKFVNDASEMGITAEMVVLTQSNADKIYRTKKTVIMDKRLIDRLSDTVSPQGVIGVYRKNSYQAEEFVCMNRILCLDGVQNSENVGALIRCAVCAGYEGVLLINACADYYSPKAVRACVGSIMKIKILNTDIQMLTRLKSEGFKVIGADVNGSETACLDYTKQVLIIGSEANGISIEAEKLCDEFVRIPIYGKCESLNAAVAGGILMYKSVGY